MLDHIGVEVSDYERSKAFYTDALKPLGLELPMEPVPGAGGFGEPADQKPFFWIGKREIYHPNYYGAYVLDPDGNNVEAVFHRAP